MRKSRTRKKLQKTEIESSSDEKAEEAPKDHGYLIPSNDEDPVPAASPDPYQNYRCAYFGAWVSCFCNKFCWDPEINFFLTNSDKFPSTPRFGGFISFSRTSGGICGPVGAAFFSPFFPIARANDSNRFLNHET